MELIRTSEATNTPTIKNNTFGRKAEFIYRKLNNYINSVLVL